MSGGYFDYNQYILQNIADDLRNLIDDTEKLEFVQDKEALIKEVDKLVKMLDYSSKVLHHIDYFLSDDIGERSLCGNILIMPRRI
ncbi:hypothetical protein TUST1-17_00160 [Vibrio phage ICP1_2006_A]|nr:hypothetical protein TUST1-159_00160 [Vibrio phage ICP1_2006_B]ADX88758.1 hypothetical protein TUST1-17_00160 [Vibrio phage ICP1_2006_A]